MLVVDPGETFDPAIDHVFVIGRGGPGADAPTVLNGEREPQFAWKAGMRHRVRLINITPERHRRGVAADDRRPGDVAAAHQGRRARCRRIACAPGPARQTIARRRDLRLRSTRRPQAVRTLWLEVRSPGGQMAHAGACDRQVASSDRCWYRWAKRGRVGRHIAPPAGGIG